MATLQIQDKAEENVNKYCSEWSNVENLESLQLQLKLGDRLEFERIKVVYYHWAIYSGCEQKCYNIIHANPPPDAGNPTGNILFNKKFAKIVEVSLISALPVGDRVRINNSVDAKAIPYNETEIIDRARQLIKRNRKYKYNLAWNNCEHFVNVCRYGIRFSEQTVKVLEIAAMSAVVGGAVAFKIATKKNKEKSFVRKDQESSILSIFFTLGLSVIGLGLVHLVREEYVSEKMAENRIQHRKITNTENLAENRMQHRKITNTENLAENRMQHRKRTNTEKLDYAGKIRRLTDHYN